MKGRDKIIFLFTVVEKNSTPRLRMRGACHPTPPLTTFHNFLSVANCVAGEAAASVKTADRLLPGGLEPHLIVPTSLYVISLKRRTFLQLSVTPALLYGPRRHGCSQ